MKYKLIGNNNYSEPIDTVLSNRGIKNKKEFLNPTINNIIHHSKLINMNRAVECIIKHIKKGSKMFIQVDCDP